ncbi:MAG: peptidylprolyl isomerase [Clostridium sp.]
MLKRLGIILLTVAISVSLVGCGLLSPKDKDKNPDTNKQSEESKKDDPEKKDDSEKKPDSIAVPKTLIQFEAPEKGEEIAVISTSEGDIKIRLFPELAPKTIENFKGLINKGYYNGVIFHRVIKDFMIQGGDPDGTGKGGESIWGKPFENEVDPSIRHFKGALSMANTGAPSTNGSQFFIVQNSKIDEKLLSQMKDIEKSDPGNFPDIIVNKYAETGGTPHLDGKHSVFGQVFEGMDIVDKIANIEVDEKDKPVTDVVIKKAEIIKY